MLITRDFAATDRWPIVYIENDGDDWALINEALTGLAISNPVRYFDTGPQALDYLRATSETPLLILCDIQMPIMNGFQLRDAIDQDPSLRAKAIPFIFFSTWADQAMVTRAYQGTIQGYHLKGERFADLQSELGLIIAYWKRCLAPKSFGGLNSANEASPHGSR